MMIASNVDPNMVEPFCAALRVNGERGDGPKCSGAARGYLVNAAAAGRKRGTILNLACYPYAGSPLRFPGLPKSGGAINGGDVNRSVRSTGGKNRRKGIA